MEIRLAPPYPHYPCNKTVTGKKYDSYDNVR